MSRELILKERAVNLFQAKLFQVDAPKEILTTIYEAFKDRVVLMPSNAKIERITDSQDEKPKDDSMGASRLAKAVEMMNERSLLEGDDIPSKVEAFYNEKAEELSRSLYSVPDDEDSRNKSNEFQKEIMQGDADLTDVGGMEMEVVDIDDEGATTEGLRQKGLIPFDFNVDEDDLPEIDDQRLPLGKIVRAQTGEIETVVSPFDEGSIVVPEGGDVFLCLNSNKRFRVDMQSSES